MKKLTYIFVFLAFLFIPIRHINAGNNFNTDLDINYFFNSSGSAQVKEDYTVTNLTSQYLISSYDYEIQGNIPENISGSDSKGPLIIQPQYLPNGNTLLHIIFNDVVAGKNQFLNFNISYSKIFYKFDNETWEIKVPKFPTSRQPDDYSYHFKIPLNFGPLVFSTSPPDNIIEENNYYLLNFDKNLKKNEDLILIFSKYRVWNINLIYNYQNHTSQPQLIYLNLPSDNGENRILVSSITPRPRNIITDDSEFWRALYEISPMSSFTATLSGQIQTLSSSPTFNFDSEGINPSFTGFSPGSYIIPDSQISTSWKITDQIFPLSKYTSFLTVTNSGNCAGYDIPLTIDSQNIVINLSQSSIPILPPGGSINIPLSFSLTLSDLFQSRYFIINSGTSHITYNISANYLMLFYASATVIISISFIAIAFFTDHAWGLYLQRRKRNNLRRKSQ